MSSSSSSGEQTLQHTPAGATPDGRQIDPNAPTLIPLVPADTRPLARSPRLEEVPAPAKIGRFTVLRELGRGGTGVVYAAFDEQLDRKVAVKLLHSETREDVARLRLMREAQAMARVSHANIVGVHEVGTFGRQVYVAMEFVHGMTLHSWLKRQRRSFAEIAATFVQAGAGLQAAHEAGLVHRDFKPANVMVGSDGRARVLDFGLARAELEPGPAPGLGDMRPAEEHASAVANLRSLDASITVTGVMLGTPAYMSPEQFLGGRVDARADQFAFCVALFEAAYRERPFKGDTLAELMSSVLAGQVRDLPAPAGVPRAVRALLLRGLARDPAARWPSMRPLLAELAAFARPPARRSWAIAAVAATLVGGAGLGLAWQTGAFAEACSGEERLSAVWNHQRREHLAEVAAASGVAQAPAAWSRAAAAFDAYGAEWAEAYGAACRQESAEQLDLRMTCLGERRDHLAAAIDMFQRPDDVLVTRVDELTASLPRIASCSDDKYLRAKVRPPDAAVAERVAAARSELTRADALELGGRFAEALKLLGDAEALVAGTGYSPVQAELSFRRGSVRENEGDYLGARSSFEDAFFVAIAAGHHEFAIDAATRLAYLVGRRLHDAFASRDWLKHAEIYAARSDDPIRRARALTVRGAIANLAGELGEARKALTEALRLYHAAGQEDTTDFARALRFYGDHLVNAGETREAIAQQERALAIMRARLGPQHPDVAMIHNSLGLVLRIDGQYERALKVFKEALDAAVDLPNQRNHVYMTLWANTGFAYEAMKQPELAEQPLREAIAVLERSSDRLLGDNYDMHNYLGMILRVTKRPDEAEVVLSATLARAEKSWGPTDPRLTQALLNLAELSRLEGRPEAAVAFAERALALTRRDPNPANEHWHYYAIWHLAAALAETGEQQRALALAHEARAFAVKQRKDSKKWVSEIDEFLTKQAMKRGGGR
ncbi:serine/threonine-protein kinase [Nannocystis bainbridge]|uniref:Serine/threonine-protein kinase n=1 Tax=Nannocystis bainbridge TaxID=2995303 RepID=A0ABT5E8Y9_9BACT|nr:serine/threonine-protein kinase [Nannocystis bainbridge]MDC0722100.1 serine/threonine-protein kinase [Nannocystis bainbridge]